MSLKNFIKINPLRFFFIIVFCIASAFGTTFGSYLLTFAMNSLRSGNFSSFLFISCSFGFLMFLGYTFSVGNKYLFNLQTQNYLHSIRSQVIKSDYQTSKSIPVSVIQNKLTNDLNILSNDYLTQILAIFNQSLAIVFSSVALISMHWSLLLLVFI